MKATAHLYAEFVAVIVSVAVSTTMIVCVEVTRADDGVKVLKQSLAWKLLATQRNLPVDRSCLYHDDLDCLRRSDRSRRYGADYS